MADKQILAKQHNFRAEAIFKTKSAILTTQRGLENLFSSLPVFRDKGELKEKAVIAFSESDLWNPDDNEENWILTAGKVENLRIAAKCLNGVEVKAGKVFSFWRHIGNPNFGKGYVTGREIREGCIVPTIAGGLCQLSNALYDAALKANFDIIERHRHTRVIKGSLAEQDRDATVKWNYCDLRFKSPKDFRIEVELTSEKLIVLFKSEEDNTAYAETLPTVHRQPGKLNDCYSCGNFGCFKHPGEAAVKRETATTTYILDEKWPEYEKYVNDRLGDNDLCILSLKQNAFMRSEQYNWKIGQYKAKTITLEGISRALKLRLAPKSSNVFKLGLELDKKIAKKAAGMIPVKSAHVVVSQNLLPFLYETGTLGGRTYDVLMTRLPMEKIHERLDAAFARYPESKTFNDFRAPSSLLAIENDALTRARKIITPHRDIAETFKHKAELLDWIYPKTEPAAARGNKVLFPASALGRKGAYELRQLVKELDLPITIAGHATESNDFWQGIKIEKFSGDLSEIGLVIYPAYVEHQPRALLKAISKGIPVITTTASGLEESEKVRIIVPGDYEHLKRETQRLLSSTPNDLS